MLRNINDLIGYSIQATDGTLGHVKDVYFDDERWVVRYLVVETGGWLESRKVLISPISLGKPDWAARVLPASITKEQVKNSPDIDTDQPVSRQHERQHLAYFGYPYYWGGGGLWGGAGYPGEMLISGNYADYLEGRADQDRADAEAERTADHHLRSCNAVMDYRIQATDGDIGTMQGLLVDEQTWAVRYMVVQTGSWWHGHQVLVAPQWIQEVLWPDQRIAVSLTQGAVRDAPQYSSSVSPSRDQEISLHRHHGRAGYWAGEIRLENPEFHLVKSASHEAVHKQV